MSMEKKILGIRAPLERAGYLLVTTEVKRRLRRAELDEALKCLQLATQELEALIASIPSAR